jgi:hypothetical protein
MARGAAVSSQTRTPLLSTRPPGARIAGASVASPRAAIWQIATKKVTTASQLMGRSMRSIDRFELVRGGLVRFIGRRRLALELPSDRLDKHRALGPVFSPLRQRRGNI